MQFRLSTIFLAFVVIAMSLAMGNLWYVLVAVAVVASLGIPESFLRGVAILGLLTLPVICLLPVRSHAGPEHRRSACANNLKNAILALHNYYDTYGEFPPVCTADEDGTPMHSWRSLILPFIEQKPLYEHQRFDEPWNGPNNASLRQMKLSAYICPCDRDAAEGKTSYVAIISPKSLWGKTLPVPIEEFNKVRELNEIAMICEWPVSGISWMEPRDLRREDIGIWLQAVTRRDFGHGKGVNVAFGSGAVSFLTWDKLGDMLQTAFDDELSDDERLMLDEYVAEAKRQAQWAALIQYATPIAWLASIVIMVVHLRIVRRKPAAMAAKPSEPTTPDKP